MAESKTALYAGSFDPLTNGHLDVVKRASRLFDTLVVAIGQNRIKSSIFSLDDRIRHLEQTCRPFSNVRVSSFSGLLAEAVKHFRAAAVVRGLRAVSDFEWELQMALMNRELEPECETIFLMPSPQYSYISSTLIREICQLGGDISPFVPEPVATELQTKISPVEGQKNSYDTSSEENSGKRHRA